jgi:hypothetical protein
MKTLIDYIKENPKYSLILIIFLLVFLIGVLIFKIETDYITGISSIITIISIFVTLSTAKRAKDIAEESKNISNKLLQKANTLKLYSYKEKIKDFRKNLFSIIKKVSQNTWILKSKGDNRELDRMVFKLSELSTEWLCVGNSIPLGKSSTIEIEEGFKKLKSFLDEIATQSTEDPYVIDKIVKSLDLSDSIDFMLQDTESGK